jgi:hypothetical protein
LDVPDLLEPLADLEGFLDADVVGFLLNALDGEDALKVFCFVAIFPALDLVDLVDFMALEEVDALLGLDFLPVFEVNLDLLPAFEAAFETDFDVLLGFLDFDAVGFLPNGFDGADTLKVLAFAVAFPTFEFVAFMAFERVDAFVDFVFALEAEGFFERFFGRLAAEQGRLRFLPSTSVFPQLPLALLDKLDDLDRLLPPPLPEATALPVLCVAAPCFDLNVIACVLTSEGCFAALF